MMRNETPVRGCGRRHAGGVYLETPLGKKGIPFNAALVCPPVPIDVEAMRLSARGTFLLERQGVWHVFDRVGTQNYPNVQDFIEEARRHGVSRRIAKTTDFSKLTPDSRLILIHDRAVIEHPEDYWRAMYDNAVAEREASGLDTEPESSWRPLAGCPRGLPEHTSHRLGDPLPRQMCHALYAEDIEGGEVVYDPAVPYRTVERTVGETTYRARRRPDEVSPTYQAGIFMTVPIGYLAVIRDPDDGTHAEALDRVNASGIDVRLEDS